MRKLYSFLLACLLLLSLVGCGGTVPATSTPESTPPTVDKPTILCWGDSLTQGAYMNDDSKEYPGILQSLVGDDYAVWNGGCNGDISYAIMARQGSIPLTTKDDIVFPAGESTVVIGHRITGSGLLRDDGMELTHINIQRATENNSPMDIQLNPVTINGAQYRLGYTFDGLTQRVDNHYNITITRDNSEAAMTIPAGSAVTLAGIDMSKQSHCDIFLMGANDTASQTPSADEINGLVARYQKAIDYHGNDNYIAIIPFWTDAYDEAFVAAFGDKALNFREPAYTNGLQAEGLQTSGVHDTNLIAQKRIPASLRYQNKPTEIHLNEKGNHFLATCVYEKGKALGYWK